MSIKRAAELAEPPAEAAAAGDAQPGSTGDADPRPTGDAGPQSKGDAGGRGRISPLQFRLAVLRHHRIVYRVAAALLRDAHEAEDVTQEAFLEYWRQGRGVRRKREWLLTVARNACLDRLRRPRCTVDPDDAHADRALTDRRDPEWHLEQQELAARLKFRIAALPEPQRSLVILFDVHGFDGAACARILGISVNQVKVYLHRARRRLRRELEDRS
ncbi:MAG: RNA polymerase sigma factor [Gammaproteobacteria bacterium]|nr:RNA polymerase sigma factor [Gammaproteobacteria bacterium]